MKYSDQDMLDKLTDSEFFEYDQLIRSNLYAIIDCAEAQDKLDAIAKNIENALNNYGFVDYPIYVEIENNVISLINEAGEVETTIKVYDYAGMQEDKAEMVKIGEHLLDLKATLHRSNPTQPALVKKVIATMALNAANQVIHRRKIG